MDARRADDDLLQCRGLLLQRHVVCRLTGYDREGVRGVAHHRKVEHTVRRIAGQRHLESPLGRCLREGQHLLLPGRAHHH